MWVHLRVIYIYIYIPNTHIYICTDTGFRVKASEFGLQGLGLRVCGLTGYRASCKVLKSSEQKRMGLGVGALATCGHDIPYALGDDVDFEEEWPFLGACI